MSSLSKTNSKHPPIRDMTDQDIDAHVRQHLVVRSQEKDEFGEVFTPPDLIHELLDNLPATLWTRADTRWLDPAAGRGNFSALVYARLMKSLTKSFPLVQERKRHILQNMLFMVELNPDNVRALKQLFGKEATIFTGDFLDGVLPKEDRFDVVLGNPPFQVEKQGQYTGSAGNRTLWDQFVKVALNTYLKSDGWLAFITPANWRRPDHPLYDLMTRQNRLHYLHIYGKAAGQKWFGVESRFDLYTIQHKQNEVGQNEVGQNEVGQSATGQNSATTIIDEMGKTHRILVKQWPFLPNYAFRSIRAILAKTTARRLPVIFSAGTYDARKLSKRKTTKFRHPVVHTITRRGLGIRFAKDRQSSQFGVPKVLLNFNERQYPYNDYKGEVGMSQLTFGLPIPGPRERAKVRGEAMIRALTSPAFQEIIRATKWSAFQTDYRMFSYFDRDFYNFEHLHR